MPNVTGYVSVRNKCGATIENVRLKVSVDGTDSPFIELPLLSVDMTSMSKKFSFPNGTISNWAVSFTMKGTQLDGNASYKLTTTDHNQMLKIMLATNEFTIAPTVSDNVTSRYDS